MEKKVMGKAPADQFYYSDWLRDVELQSASACSKGVWINMLARMWFANPRGEIHGTKEQLIKLCICTSEEFDIFWDDAQTLGFCYTSQNTNNILTIRNRRMFREEKARESNRLRQQRHYDKRKSNGQPNGNLTPPSSSASSSAKKKENIKRKVPLPKDYKLTKEHLEYARVKGVDEYAEIEYIFEAFCIHHRKQGSKFIDWYAAWQTWIRKHIEFKKSRGPEGGPLALGNGFDPGSKSVIEAREDMKHRDPEKTRANLERIGKMGMGATKDAT